MIHVSYILPFYKRAEWLSVVAAHNACFRAPHSEVVLVLDEPTQEEQVLEIVRGLPSIKWRVIVNDEDHAWRPPCKAINVGVRNAVGDFIVIASPETLIFLPDPDYVERLAESLRDKERFVGGSLWLVKEPTSPQKFPREAVDALGAPPTVTRHGFMGTWKRLFITAGGMDESRTAWGGDDSLLHRLLEWISYPMVDSNIRVVSPLHGGPVRVQQAIGPIRRSCWETNGWAFSRIAYDYRGTSPALPLSSSGYHLNRAQ